MQTTIWLAGACAFSWAAYKENLAAMYIAGFFGVLATTMHAIEFKLNKLLAQHGIKVGDYEIASD